MPAINYEIKDLDLFTYDATKLFVDRDNRMFKLVQRNAEGFYDPSALFPDSAEIIFPNFVAKALTSFFGFEPCEVYDEDSEGNEYKLEKITEKFQENLGGVYEITDGSVIFTYETNIVEKISNDKYKILFDKPIIVRKKESP